jgi:hypothetical protein
MILLTVPDWTADRSGGVPPDLLSVGIFLPTIANGHSVGLSAFDDALSIDPDGPVDDRHGIDHNRSSCLDYGDPSACPRLRTRFSVTSFVSSRRRQLSVPGWVARILRPSADPANLLSQSRPAGTGYPRTCT